MNTKFEHKPVNLSYNNLVTEEGNNGRFYLTPEGKYPSITTVLSVRNGNFLEEWRKRVGKETADKISRQATIRGELVHNLFERYLNNEEIDLDSLMPQIRQNFKAIQRVLDEHVSVVYGQELPLYSSHLELAGRVDCVGIYDNKLSIIDFKTSSRVKKKEEISNYFMQAAAYAIMWEERTGMPIVDLKILMCPDNHKNALVFSEKRDNWVDELFNVIKEWKKKN